MQRKVILFHPPSPQDAPMFDAPDDDAGATPWIHVRNRFRQSGVEVATSYRYSGRLEDVAWVVFMNIPAELASPTGALRACIRSMLKRPASDGKLFYAKCLKAGLRQRLSAILWEPAVVQESNYCTWGHRKFSRVFTWASALQARGGRYAPIVCPQAWPVAAPLDVPFAERKLLCNLSGNKLSAHPRELYSARVSVIRYMEQHALEEFDHYGPGWEGYPSWRGVVPNKLDVFPKYRFGLCYENMRDEAGYMTEKLIDCLVGGCVPVYWGDPDIALSVPAAAFVDRRQFADDATMVRHLQAMPETQWRAMREAGQAFLHSPAFNKFKPEAMFQHLRQGLSL